MIIQRYEPDYDGEDACMSFNSLGGYIKFSDHARDVAEQVEAAVKAERERWLKEKCIQITLGNGRVACGFSHNNKGQPGITMEPLESQQRVGSEATDSAQAEDMPAFVVRITNVEAASVLLGCVYKCMAYLCQPDFRAWCEKMEQERDEKAAVHAVQEAKP